MTKQASHYVTDTIGFVLCTCCLAIAVSKSEKVKNKFEELTKAINSEKTIRDLNYLKRNLPKGTHLLFALLGESQNIFTDEGIPKGRALIKGAQKLAEELDQKIKKPFLWKFWGKGNPEDNLNSICRSIEELIKFAFNKNSEKEAGQYKVTGTKLLFFTVVFSALSEANQEKLENFEKQGFMPLGKRFFSIEELRSGKLTDDAYRIFTKEMKADGFEVRSNDVIYNQAINWYQCRVKYSGPTEYCLKEEKWLEPTNVSNEIRACDVAMGYPRRGIEEKNSNLGRREEISLLLNASILMEAYLGLEPLLNMYKDWKIEEMEM